MRRGLIPFIALILTSGSAKAQILNVTNATSTPVPGSGHDYIGMLSETVNPANGSVSMRIQVPVPSGRGLSMPFAFAYDSNGVHHPESTSNGTIQWFSNTSFLSNGGWSYSTPLMSNVWAQKSYTLPSPPAPPNTTYTCGYHTGYVFQDPSGGRHSLYLARIMDPYSQGCRYFGLENASVLSGGDTFFLAKMEAIGSPLSVAGPDGTVYHFSSPEAHDGPLNTSQGLPDYIEDRNGNKVSITDLGGGGFTYLDTLGRTVVSSSGFGTTGNTVSISGLPAPYTINWGTASYNYSVGATVLSGNPGDCWLVPAQSGTQPVIASITLPNNKQYLFHYESTYGLLDKVTYPTGGYVRYVWAINTQSEAGAFTDSYGNAGGCLEAYGAPAVLHRYVSFDGSCLASAENGEFSR